MQWPALSLYLPWKRLVSDNLGDRETLGQEPRTGCQSAANTSNRLDDHAMCVRHDEHELIMDMIIGNPLE